MNCLCFCYWQRLLHQLNDWAQYSHTHPQNLQSSVAAVTGGVQNGVGQEETDGLSGEMVNGTSSGSAVQDSATSELMQRLVDVIFYLCQGDLHTATADSSRIRQETGRQTEQAQAPVSSPVRESQTPAAVSRPQQISGPRVSAEHFRVPRVTVHSDVYAI